MKVLLTTLPDEGQVKDYTTPGFYRNPAVPYMPLGLLAVAAGVKGHEVKILDPASFGWDIADTLRGIEVYHPDVLGISAVTQKAWAMTEILRWAEVPFKAVGGPHADLYPDTIPAAIFTRDGDFSFGHWLDAGCPDGIFNDNVTDLDCLPATRWELLNASAYELKSAGDTLLKHSGLRYNISTSRGCPFRCVFCGGQDKAFRFKSAHRVVNEMEAAVYRGADLLHVIDDCFNIRRDRVLAICAEIKRRNFQVEWSARGRIILDRETAGALVDVGCRRLHVGVESLDPAVLKWMNKAQDVETIVSFFALCHEFGIETLAYFMVGSPGETAEYRHRLPDLIRDLGVTYPYFNILYPLPHTEYYQDLLRSGVFKEDHWATFARNPQPNFELPLPRSQGLQQEMEETVAGYIREFYGRVPQEVL